jgi:tRNA(fMet)-specific endonuclease VapC
VKFLLDTDHISTLQQQSGPEFVALSARMAQCQVADLAFSVVSFHEQVLGCHTYINRARRSADVVRGYEMLGRVLRSFSAAPMLHFDAPVASTLDGLLAQRVRLATMDLRIPAIALSLKLTLLTRNSQDFGKVPGLVTEDWAV